MRIKRKLSIILALALVVSCFTMQGTSVAAKKASIAKKKLTMAVGEKKYVSIRNKNKSISTNMSAARKRWYQSPMPER